MRYKLDAALNAILLALLVANEKKDRLAKSGRRRLRTIPKQIAVYSTADTNFTFLSEGC